MKTLPVWLTLIILLGITACASADSREKSVSRATSIGSEYYWYDGDTQRRVQLQNDSDTINKLASPSKDGSQARTVPVFRSAGQRMTLPGGIIVKFQSSWQKKQIIAWMQANGFKQYSPLVSDSTWLIDTPPGLKSLQIANGIHEGGEVVYASPNWARERTHR